MGKWICKVCGYTHHGDEPLERCPQCGASRSQFYEERRSSWNLFRIFLVFATLALIFFCLCSCKTPLTVDNSAVKTVDLEQYAGRWYEVARFDHMFEKGMMQCTATYTLQENGTVKVVNRGLKDGKWKTSEGKCKVTDEPGVLRVSFFGPFYSDYRIMMLAPDYSYSLVGGESDDYLWILSRTPQLKQETLDQIIYEAHRRGYKTSDLIWVQREAVITN